MSLATDGWSPLDDQGQGKVTLMAICVFQFCRVSLTYGLPSMIDVRDCDARLPSSGSADDVYMDEFLRLSIILGRVLKDIYR